MPISMRRIEEVLTPLTSELSARAANATVGNADIRSGEFATDRFESAVNRPAAHVAPNVNMPMLDDLDVEEAATVYLKDRLTRLAADKAAFHTLLGDIFQAPKARIEALRNAIQSDAFANDEAVMLDGEEIHLIPEMILSSIRYANGADCDFKGAYSAADQVIYLADDVSGNIAYEIALEELGHHLDALLNDVDQAGDEGEAFRHGVLGSVNDATKAGHNALSETQLLEIDGELKEVECGRQGKGALGDPKTADINTLVADCIKHGRFDWTFTTGQTLLEYVLSLPDDWKKYKEEVCHLGPTGKSGRWHNRSFKVPLPADATVVKVDGFSRRQSVSSGSDGGWGRTGFPGKSCWFELNDETPAHLKNKEVHAKMWNQIHDQWHQAKVTVDYTVPNKEKIKHAKDLEAALLKFTSRSLDQGNIRGVDEVLKRLVQVDSKYRNADHGSEAEKVMAKAAKFGVDTGMYHFENASKKNLSEILGQYFAKQGSQMDRVIARSRALEEAAEGIKSSNALTRGKFVECLNRDSDLISAHHTVGSSGDTLLDIAKKEKKGREHAIYSEALRKRLEFRLKRGDKLSGADLNELIQHRIVPVPGSPEDNANAFIPAIKNVNGTKRTFGQWLETPVNVDERRRISDAMVKDIVETPDWADADLGYDTWHYWKTANAFGNLMQLKSMHEDGSESKPFSTSRMLRPTSRPGRWESQKVALTTSERQVKNYTVQVRIQGQGWKTVPVPHREPWLTVSETVDAFGLGERGLEVTHQRHDRSVEVRVDGEYVERVKKPLSVFDRLAKADGDDTTRMEALTKTVIERGTDFFNPDASPYAETQAARETNKTAEDYKSWVRSLAEHGRYLVTVKSTDAQKELLGKGELTLLDAARLGQGVDSPAYRILLNGLGDRLAQELLQMIDAKAATPRYKPAKEELRRVKKLFSLWQREGQFSHFTEHQGVAHSMESLLKLAGQKRLAARLGRRVKSENRQLMSTLTTAELVNLRALHDPKSKRLLEELNASFTANYLGSNEALSFERDSRTPASVADAFSKAQADAKAHLKTIDASGVTTNVNGELKGDETSFDVTLPAGHSMVDFKVYLDNAETDIADMGWVSFKPVEGTDTFRVTVKNETQATHAIPVRIEALSIAQEA